MTLLLDSCGDQITITEEVVKAIIANFDMDVVISFFDRCASQITITEYVVVAAAGNSRNGKQVMALLLDPLQRPDHDH